MAFILSGKNMGGERKFFLLKDLIIQHNFVPLHAERKLRMERLWNKNYCKVMAANFSLFFAFYVLTPLLPLYLSEHFGATKDVIGLVLSG